MENKNTSETITIEQLASFKLIPVLRYQNEELALQAACIIAEAGSAVIELTMTTPGALNILRKLSQEFPALVLGVGSLFHTDDMKRAADAGAHFLVSPHLNCKLIQCANTLHKAYLPGTLTPSEVALAQSEGAKGVKIFPAQPVGGVAYLRSLLALFPNLFFVPTGGINKTNFQAYLKLPKVAVGTTSLLSAEQIEKQDKISLIQSLQQTYFEPIQHN